MKISTFDLEWYRNHPHSVRTLDEWSRPGLTNFLGSCQVGNDVSSVRHALYPPVSGAEESTAYLSVNGTLLSSSPSATTHRWTPWSVVRETAFEDLSIQSTLAMPPDEHAAAMGIELTNTASLARTVSVALRLSGRVVNQDVGTWYWGVPQVGLSVVDLHDQRGMNPQVERIDRRGILFHSSAASSLNTSDAWNGQAVHPVPDHWEPSADPTWIWNLEPGERRMIYWTMVMGEAREEVVSALSLVESVPSTVARAEAMWRSVWASCFSADGPIEGRLPDLDLPEDVVPVATSAILSALMVRRTHRVAGSRVRYSISMPRRVETCFYPNDWSMAGFLLARLEPTATREQLEMALRADVRRHNQINTITGRGGDFTGVSWPYTIDIYNLFFVIYSLWRTRGFDPEFLTHRMETHSGPQTILAVMESLAQDYRTRLHPDLGLADYGPRQELLECVSTYEHMVASINAGAVWMLDRMSDLFRDAGAAERADAYRREADTLAHNILSKLYVKGKGFFCAIQPDGTRREVRHAWDTGMVLMCMADRLPTAVRAEMIAFFRQELQTTTWLRALSPRDLDAAVSGIRADHQFTGAFGSWPAEILIGLARIGEHTIAWEWLRGIARTARQGPFGQAHYDEALCAVAGGAGKVTDEYPQCCHWANISGAMFLEALYELTHPKNGGDNYHEILAGDCQS